MNDNTALYYSYDNGSNWIFAGIYPTYNDTYDAQYSIQRMNFGKFIQFQRKYV